MQQVHPGAPDQSVNAEQSKSGASGFLMFGASEGNLEFFRPLLG
jgi:hypothetical protein